MIISRQIYTNTEFSIFNVGWKADISQPSLTRHELKKAIWNKSSATVELAAQCCTNGIYAVTWGYLSLTHSFSVISENITIDHTRSKTRFLGLHFCRRQYGSNFNDGDVIGPKATEFGETTQHNEHMHGVHDHSRSSVSIVYNKGSKNVTIFFLQNSSLNSIAYIYLLVKFLFCLFVGFFIFICYQLQGASIPPEAMVRSPQDGRMGTHNFWL